MTEVGYIEVYAIGPVSASVCTTLSPDEAARALNREHPTGISSSWKWAEGVAFADGSPNPSPCNVWRVFPHQHYLFHC